MKKIILLTLLINCSQNLFCQSLDILDKPFTFYEKGKFFISFIPGKNTSFTIGDTINYYAINLNLRSTIEYVIVKNWTFGIGFSVQRRLFKLNIPTINETLFDVVVNTKYHFVSHKKVSPFVEVMYLVGETILYKSPNFINDSSKPFTSKIRPCLGLNFRPKKSKKIDFGLKKFYNFNIKKSSLIRNNMGTYLFFNYHF